MSEATRYPFRQTIVTAQDATGTGNAVNVQDFMNIQLEISTETSADLTVNIQGSFADTAPDFSTTATTANPWTYIASYDYNDPSSVIVGATGIVYTGTDAVRNLLVNVDGLAWVNVTVTAYAAGTVTVKCLSFNNQ